MVHIFGMYAMKLSRLHNTATTHFKDFCVHKFVSFMFDVLLCFQITRKFVKCHIVIQCILNTHTQRCVCIFVRLSSKNIPVDSVQGLINIGNIIVRKIRVRKVNSICMISSIKSVLHNVAYQILTGKQFLSTVWQIQLIRKSGANILQAMDCSI